jgi:hypothetical protein
MADLIVRDSFATLNGDGKVITMPSGGLEIVAEDGRTMFEISLKGNVLHVSGGCVCKFADGKLYDDRFMIRPVAGNCVDLVKNKYEP